MSKNLQKLGRSLGLVIAFLVVFEGFVFLRWTFFSGPEPSLHDLHTGLGILIAIWAVSKLAGWFERREARDKEVAARIRAIDARVEGLYKWGALCHSGDDGKDNDDWEWESDHETKAEIAECREGIKRGDTTSRHNLGVIFWNHAMTHYNARTKDGYRETIRWLRKAASVGYDCENTLGDACLKLQDYDEAMYWYRRTLKRGGSLAWIAESNIADMYAEGQGVSKNHAEAAWWWERAAQHGSDWSHYKLGKLYQGKTVDGVIKEM
jgi:TPR repeat protein